MGYRNNKILYRLRQQAEKENPSHYSTCKSNGSNECTNYYDTTMTHKDHNSENSSKTLRNTKGRITAKFSKYNDHIQVYKWKGEKNLLKLKDKKVTKVETIKLNKSPVNLEEDNILEKNMLNLYSKNFPNKNKGTQELESPVKGKYIKVLYCPKHQKSAPCRNRTHDLTSDKCVRHIIFSTKPASKRTYMNPVPSLKIANQEAFEHKHKATDNAKDKLSQVRHCLKNVTDRLKMFKDKIKISSSDIKNGHIYQTKLRSKILHGNTIKYWLDQPKDRDMKNIPKNKLAHFQEIFKQKTPRKLLDKVSKGKLHNTIIKNNNKNIQEPVHPKPHLHNYLAVHPSIGNQVFNKKETKKFRNIKHENRTDFDPTVMRTICK